MIPGINPFTEKTLDALSADERCFLHWLIVDGRTLLFDSASPVLQRRYAAYAQLEAALIAIRKQKGDFSIQGK